MILMYFNKNINTITMTKKCIDCKIYYGNIQFDNKCSACSGLYDEYKYFPWRLDDFRNKVHEWINENTIKENNPYYIVLKFNIKRNNLQQTKIILKNMKKEKIFISTELAIFLLRKIGLDTIDKTHLICPFILDWWNINSSNNFNSTEKCYYGIFDDNPEDHIKSFPPKLPNMSLYKKWRV